MLNALCGLFLVVSMGTTDSISDVAFQFHSLTEPINEHRVKLYSTEFVLRWRGNGVTTKNLERPVRYRDKKSSIVEIDVTEILIAEAVFGSDPTITYRIAISSDPSFDPHFEFYKVLPDGTDEPISHAFVGGYELTLLDPEKGVLEVSGHTDNMFDQHALYVLSEGQPTEIPQPYRYAGLKSKTKKPLALFADEALQNQIATIPSGTAVEVLLSDKDEDKYLLLFDTNTVGWVHVSEHGQKDETLEGVFFHGD